MLLLLLDLYIICAHVLSSWCARALVLGNAGVAVGQQKKILAENSDARQDLGSLPGAACLCSVGERTIGLKATPQTINSSSTRF